MRKTSAVVAIMAVFTLAVCFIMIGSISEELKARLSIGNSDIGTLVFTLSLTVKRNFGFHSRIIVGSVKTQNHVLSALRAGVDIAMVPEALFFQIFRHPLTDEGLAAFKQDWKKVAQ